ncbi:MAG: MarR family transcriptional regulator [Bacteroidales bacterium]|jgi:DNA-binding MarR family transcriptional regulator|nr:MarR family transcriptional regulator [Bacteroidales bacterium]
MNTQNFPNSLRIAVSMKIIEHAFDKLIFTKHNLTAQSHGVLLLAYFVEGITQNEIAELAKTDKSAVLRQIDLLEKEKLVCRKTDAQDRRKNHIMVTERGKLIVQNIVNEEKRVFSSLMEGIDEQEFETFYKVLNVMKINAEKV